jgi:Uma2 family endonuclease
MAVPLPHRQFSSDEYWRMVKAGVIREDERVELLDGEIVTMSPIGPRHAWCVNDLNRIFGVLLGRVILSVQSPLHLGDRSDPEPDLAILRPETPRRRHPGPGDVLLLIEVSSSSLAVDRDVKAPLYAAGEVPEYWLVDLDHERLEVYREPMPEGFRLVRTYRRGERVSPLFAPDFEIEVDEILGPAEGG